jgi:formate dehydrogenase iron-sulfur subunit
VTVSQESLLPLLAPDPGLRGGVETAAVAFAEWSREQQAQEATPEAADSTYRRLLPLERPAAGQQFAFEVDLDSCSGCKACVVACHRLNGLDEDEAWRQVGLLQGGRDGAAVMQHVTTSCHHCLEPSCMQGCPVNAYEKDPATGIVRHLDDQCIGCQYCILKCPYDAPQYNPRLGIVRKCDMCAQRLDAGQPPACVESCPTQAIRIRLVSVQQITDDAEANLFLSGAAEPAYTLPTTVYRSRRGMPANLLPADYYAARPQHAHWPLVWMLVLTQVAVGAVAGGWLLAANYRGLSGWTPVMNSWSLEVAAACGLLGMGAAVMHLGRPWLAFRALLGLMRSWLSREILAFQIFGLSAAAYGLGHAWKAPPSFFAPLGLAATLAGVAAILCSAMVYVDTHRVYWNGPATIAKFLLTATAAGAWVPALLWLMVATGAAVPLAVTAEVLRLCTLVFALAVIGKLLIELSVLRHLVERRLSHQRRTSLLLVGPLRRVTVARVTCAGAALLLSWSACGNLSIGTTATWVPVILAGLALALWFAGETCERYLFFAAVIAPKMPGAPAS